MISGNNSVVLQTKNLCFQTGLTVLLKDINIQLMTGESMAVTGPSGSGKTTLGKILAGIVPATKGELFFPEGIKRLMVDQQDHFIAQAGLKTTYYSQRYESIGDDDSPDIYTYLYHVLEKSGLPASPDRVQEVIVQVQIEDISRQKLMQLSNGERKRTQLAAALIQRPGLLVLDQPFVGLDNKAKKNLLEIISKLTDDGIIMIVICDKEHIPNTIHKVLELQNGKVSQFTDRRKYNHSISSPDHSNFDEPDEKFFELLPIQKETFTEVIAMKKVNVSIGEKTILKNIDWKVKGGEQWALLGPNGAGKTTLLSLVTADNPQGYSNDLVLFDRKRGSGETIWEIKERIGFVSPELHLYFLHGDGIFNSVPELGEKAQHSYNSLSCTDVIVSGFRDEIGFVSSPTGLQYKIANAWLSVFKMEHLQKRKFYQASLGEQRTLLLARALVKSPALLVLDEPCQGLDPFQTSHFIQILDFICRKMNTTLVYVTHIREEIPSCVKNLLQLEKGRVIYSGKI